MNQRPRLNTWASTVDDFTKEKGLAFGSGAINAVTDIPKYIGLAGNYALEGAGLIDQDQEKRNSLAMYDMFDNVGTEAFAAERRRLARDNPYTHLGGELIGGAAGMVKGATKLAFKSGANSADLKRYATALGKSALQEAAERTGDLAFKVQ